MRIPKNLITNISLPHVRGGVSRDKKNKKSPPKSSPRAWGCFEDVGEGELIKLVFPTCVGVFPLWRA